jgi:transcriptional regulator with XRE-family HTH domain
MPEPGTVSTAVQPRTPVRPSTRVVRRNELAALLRSPPGADQPGDQVGSPEIGRRRTPGLRREEVAQLAGVGVAWYTWVEQGRDIKASEQVLAAIAGTLRLDPYERAHLFSLAGARRQSVAQLRADGRPHRGAELEGTGQRLRQESPEFESLWQQHDVQPMRNLSKRFRHPSAGDLHLD